jgi:hypothetical protein
MNCGFRDVEKASDTFRPRFMTTTKETGSYLLKFFQLPYEFVLWHHATLPPQNLPLPENDKGRYGTHLVHSRGLGIFVDINLNDGGRIFDGILYFFQDRCQGFTGPTPLGRKIYQYGFFGVDHLVKCHRFLFFSLTNSRKKCLRRQNIISRKPAPGFEEIFQN